MNYIKALKGMPFLADKNTAGKDLATTEDLGQYLKTSGGNLTGLLTSDSGIGLRVRSTDGSGIFSNGISILTSGELATLCLGTEDRSSYFGIAQRSWDGHCYLSIQRPNANRYDLYFPSHSGILALQEEVLSKSGGVVNGRMAINPGGADDYSEGLRINRANNGWAGLYLGGAPGTTQGMSDSFMIAVSGDQLILSKSGRNASCVTIDANNYLYEHGSRVMTKANFSLSGTTLTITI